MSWYCVWDARTWKLGLVILKGVREGHVVSEGNLRGRVPFPSGLGPFGQREHRGEVKAHLPPWNQNACVLSNELHSLPPFSKFYVTPRKCGVLVGVSAVGEIWWSGGWEHLQAHSCVTSCGASFLPAPPSLCPASLIALHPIIAI